MNISTVTPTAIIADAKPLAAEACKPLCYIVAATPRTGSSLLCWCLEHTRIAGRPAEVFSPGMKQDWFRLFKLSENATRDEYIQAARNYGTTRNNVFAFKIHWQHLRGFARNIGFTGPAMEVLNHLFPQAEYINIIRRDKRAQALSFFRAFHTREWRRFKRGAQVSPPAPAPQFDAEAILAHEQQLIRHQLNWERYFKTMEITPLVIEYETLAKDYRRQTARALNFLGLDDAPAWALKQPRLIKQADKHNLEWRELLDRHGKTTEVNDELAP
jgi:trehalose 2-sulfotransferase